jgi:phosphoribosylanthranilate isomerase
MNKDKAIKLKLCGINNLKILDYILTLNYQPDFLGFIFYPPSPRNINYKFAQNSNQILSKQVTNIKKVAVTVNPTLTQLNEIIKNLHPDYIQHHGDDLESLLITTNLLKKSSIKLIKAIGLKNNHDLDNLNNLDHNLIDYFLFDTASKKHGGTGKVFDWKILEKYQINLPYFLSGGINIDNIAKALKTTNNNLLDICSGIENAQGVKDLNKISKILEYVKLVNNGSIK